MQAGARDEEERAEGGVGFLADADRFAEGAAAEQREIGVGGGATLAPEVVDVVAGIEGETVGRAGRHMGGEAVRGGGLALHEVPEGNEAGRAGDGGDAVGGCGGKHSRSREGRADYEKRDEW